MNDNLIKKVGELLPVTLRQTREARDEWRAIGEQALAEQITARLTAGGMSRRRAETSAAATIRAIRKAIHNLDEVHSWLATADNTLAAEKLID